MRYTIRHQGRVLGTTALDCYQLIHGQHSGWFFPEPGADLVLDAVSIKSAYIRAWMLRGDTLGDGGRLTEPDLGKPRECEKITTAVSARAHLLLTLHRDDGSELPTQEIILQDRMYWEAPDFLDEEEALAEEDDEEPAAPFAPDFAVMCQWNPETGEESTTSMDDDEWRKFVEARWLEAEESRYQVHLRLANPDDMPSQLIRLTEKAK